MQNIIPKIFKLNWCIVVENRKSTFIDISLTDIEIFGFEELIYRLGRDSKEPGRFGLGAIRFFQGASDKSDFDIIEKLVDLEPLDRLGKVKLRARPNIFIEFQVLRSDGFSLGKHGGLCDDLPKFADIAGPVILGESSERLCAEATLMLVLGIPILQQVGGQLRDI